MYSSNPSSASIIKVLIADDHAIVRAGIGALLRHLGGLETVSEAANGEQAIKLTLDTQPDLVLIDLRMPVMGGVEAIRQIKVCRPATKVVVLTACSGDEDVFKAIQAGANGFLLKDASPEELRTCIQHVMTGRSHITPASAQALAARICVDSLTKRELEILQSIAAGDANKLIAYDLKLSTGTVKSHVQNILAKLNAKSRTHAVMIAQKRGLVEVQRIAVDGKKGRVTGVLPW